jgi:hypothetical protein
MKACRERRFPSGVPALLHFWSWLRPGTCPECFRIWTPAASDGDCAFDGLINRSALDAIGCAVNLGGRQWFANSKSSASTSMSQR